MRIKSISIRDFKRFTDLQIINIPETTKLVILIGSNGSGKTSLFEAFNFWIYPGKHNGATSFQADYHFKQSSLESNKNHSNLYNKIKFEFYDSQSLDPRNWQIETNQIRKMFYIRSPYRNEATFESSNIGKMPPMIEDSRSPSLLISPEARVSDNYNRIVSDSVNLLYSYKDDDITIRDARERLVGKIRAAMSLVFPNLLLKGIGDPMQNGTFVFEKGESKNYPYKNLSGGEKAIFDLLLDFVIKTEVFDNTVYCIDEPELHIHTKLQSQLLRYLFNNLPEKCQLWIATHSIGMMQCAMELYKQNSQEVVFLDFDGHDFDKSVVIEPAIVNRQFWKKVFAVALDDLAELVAPKQIIFCEGKTNDPSGRGAFDVPIYQTIFSTTHPETEFYPIGGTNDISTNLPFMQIAFQKLLGGVKIWSVIDRDDRSSEEIKAEKALGKCVLRRRDLENYLWDDEILEKLCSINEKSNLFADIRVEKIRLMNKLSLEKKPQDDVKAISGELYNYVKRQLGLTQHGNTASAFCKITLAPLITPDTKIYRELEEDIFGVTS